MSWLFSIGAALLTGLVCGAGSLWLSDRVVRWYHITSFEGASGYAMVGLTLVGALAAVVIGLIAARVGVACGWTSFGGQLLWALGAGLATLAIVALVTRALADVPPTLEGRTLDMVVEIRFPLEQTQRPQITQDQASLHLGALKVIRRVVRERRTGTLQLDEMRQEDGRWIVPGRVEVFTSRGKRIMWVSLGETTQGFLVPLPSHPGAKHREWSAWLPNPQPPGTQDITALTYRFRVEASEE